MNGNGRGIGCENGSLVRRGFHIGKNALLNSEILKYGLNYKICIFKQGVVVAGNKLPILDMTVKFKNSARFDFLFQSFPYLLHSAGGVIQFNILH